MDDEGDEVSSLSSASLSLSSDGEGEGLIAKAMRGGGALAPRRSNLNGHEDGG